jgi:hypothetical protein
MSEEEEREKMRYELEKNARVILTTLETHKWKTSDIFDALPLIFVLLCDDLKKDYGFEITAFTMKAKAYRNWLHKKEEVKK